MADTGDGVTAELLEVAAGLMRDAGEGDIIVVAIGRGVEIVVENGRGRGDVNAD